MKVLASLQISYNFSVQPSGLSLRTGLFQAAYLHTNDAIISSQAEDTGVTEIQCAARCLHKAYKVRTSKINLTI